jgi:hypothetical protein
MPIVIPSALQKRIDALPVSTVRRARGGSAPEEVRLIERFGLLVDTRRDTPQIQTFDPYIPRGKARLTLVDYEPKRRLLWPSMGKAHLPIPLHQKHVFVTEEWFADWMTERMLAGDPADPRDKDGYIQTTLLRDARKPVYLVKSFRQIVMHHYHKLGKT